MLQELGLRARRLAPLDESRHDAEPRRQPPAPGDGEVGSDARARPGRCPASDRSSLTDEADEGVLEDVLRDVGVARHGDEEGEDLAPVLQVELAQLDLVRGNGRVQALHGGDRLVRHGRLGHPAHAGMTILAARCRKQGPLSLISQAREGMLEPRVARLQAP